MSTRTPDRYNTPWRKLAGAIYRAPVDGRIYGTLDLDVTAAQRFIEASRKSGIELTMTSLVTAAIGRALAFDAPELNCFIRRGRVIPRQRVEVLVSVALDNGRDMGGLKIWDAHLKPAAQIAREIRDGAKAFRAGDENRTMQNKQLLGSIPWPLRGWVVRALAWLTNGIGLELKPLGLSQDAFGSLILSNIGTFGLSTGFLALFPVARLPAAVAMGRAEQKPVVRDGEIVIRTMLPMTATFDHRLVDGALAGKLAQSVARWLSRAEALDQAPAAPSPPGLA